MPFSATSRRLSLCRIQERCGSCLKCRISAQDSVTRGNKAFDVHANTYRMDADVVPVSSTGVSWARRKTTGLTTGTSSSLITGERSSTGPGKTTTMASTKNDATGRRFKAVVRILKRLRNEMAGQRISGSRAHSLLSHRVPGLERSRTKVSATTHTAPTCGYALAHLLERNPHR